MTIYKIPVRPIQPEYREIEADSVKEACEIAEKLWPDTVIVDICIECGEPRAVNKVFCQEHFNEWHARTMSEILSR